MPKYTRATNFLGDRPTTKPSKPKFRKCICGNRLEPEDYKYCSDECRDKVKNGKN